MKITLEKNRLIIDLTDQEKQKFLLEGLKGLINNESGVYTYKLPQINWNPEPTPIPRDNDKNTSPVPFPNWTYTSGTNTSTYKADCDWPWKDKDGHMIGGAQLDNPSKYPCEASDFVKKH